MLLSYTLCLSRTHLLDSVGLPMRNSSKLYNDTLVYNDLRLHNS